MFLLKSFHLMQYGMLLTDTYPTKQGTLTFRGKEQTVPMARWVQTTHTVHPSLVLTRQVASHNSQQRQKSARGKVTPTDPDCASLQVLILKAVFLSFVT